MIPKEFWERFKTGAIAVECQTEDEKNDFVKQFNIRCNKYTGFNSINGICYYNSKETFGYKKSLDYIYTELGKTYCVIKYSKDKCIIRYNYQLIPYSEINKSIKEENKMFRCSFCGKEYDTPVSRAKCEIECDKLNQAKAEKERQNKLKAEKEKRIEELDKARVEYFETWTEAKEKYLKLVEQYNKDYGVTASCSYSNVYPSNYFQDIIDKMIYGK